VKSDISIEQIIKNILAGDRASFGDLIEVTQKPLFTFCFHLTKNKQLAEDLTHDTYLKAHSHLKELKDASQVLAWLKKIARNMHLDFVKSAANKTNVSVEDYNEFQANDFESATTSQIDTLKILSKLDQDDQLILVLVDLQECSYAEAAQVLEITEGTVKSRLARAREKFSELFENKNGTKKPYQASNS
jgi:RNA polymerase sigma-70 factor (ECF subfamily)